MRFSNLLVPVFAAGLVSALVGGCGNGTSGTATGTGGALPPGPVAAEG